MKKVILVSVPAPAIKQTPQEREYWKWHYALKARLTYPHLTEKQFLTLGNAENQNVGLLSIASVLIDKGVVVKYLAPSLTFAGKRREQIFLDILLKEVIKVKPNFVGFSSHTCAINTAIKYARQVKKICPQTKTVIGGPHASGSNKVILKELMKQFDFVIRGKGEIPFLELIQDNKNTCGISYREGNIETINPLSVTSISSYPNPANNLLNIRKLPAARIFTSLGCRKGAQCVFCADILHNKSYITRPTEEVLAEIDYLYKNMGTRYFYIGDENFFLDKKRALEIMERINWLDLDIIVGYQVRVESADEDLIKKAAESGKCTEIQFGVESASQDVLNLNKKGLRIRNVEKICKLANLYGINTHCYFLVGLPGETRDTAGLTIKKIEELLSKGIVDFVEYRCTVPFPGSPMWEQAKLYGVKLKHQNWLKYRGENPPPFDLRGLTSGQIYKFYLMGLEKISNLYKRRYLKEFGNKLPDVRVLSAVTEGGF